MNWLTISEIEEAAKESTPAAITSSKIHWYQMKDAPVEKLREACKEGLVDCWGDSCALCRRFYNNITNKCSNENGICPLSPSKGQNSNCCSEWSPANREVVDTIKFSIDHRGEGVQAMCKRLDALEAEYKCEGEKITEIQQAIEVLSSLIPKERKSRSDYMDAFALLSEVEKQFADLQAENERLNGWIAMDKGKIDDLFSGIQKYKQQIADLQAENERLKKELGLACRSIERLYPPPMMGFIGLADGSIFNLQNAKQIAGLDLTKREAAINKAEEVSK